VSSWASLVAGLVRAFNLIAGWARDTQLRRQGAEKAQLETLKTRNDIRRKADEIDEHAVSDSDGDILKRL